mmetsp:Transcript_6731/g.11240  ORF Transcript_6731/g.11240 Transcript_6731/m.11240 type:complete len:217 (-) Transcript_6731:293-943(-)|eukprot:CAMPEP_0174959454 /NCGR_PEP_ID=MMETSP0004_2-20121128/3184_1 /TAXON_ID=420556 /ORGANISM="Ochromonas sp., Strain CCMP1393" /LENGTH=216 /DNA_ID=CAMNT_0016207771 /DNA_START=52 /DNA_END=702 /DNA_ORIENTATION=+
MSRITVSKQQVKKTQGQLKGLVTNFGSLIISWRSDVEQVVALLEHNADLLNKARAVQRSEQDPTLLRSVFRGADPSAVTRRICAKIQQEMDSVMRQIKSFEKRLQEDLAAMLLYYDEAFKCILNEPMQLFDDSSIFTAEHVLEMQQLVKFYSLELDRKLLLTKSILNEPSVNRDIGTGSSVNATDNTAAMYADTAASSLIDTDKVEAFLLRNQIKT